MMTPASIPRNGSEIAVTTIVTPAIHVAPPLSAVRAAAALSGNVTIAPSTNRKPTIDALGESVKYFV